MTPEEYADNHERRLTTAHQMLMKGFGDGQEFIKSALRKEIEKERDRLKELLDKGIDDFHAESMACAKYEAFNYTLSKLDSVTPPKQ